MVHHELALGSVVRRSTSLAEAISFCIYKSYCFFKMSRLDVRLPFSR